MPSFQPRYDACLQVCPSSAASEYRTQDYGSRNRASSRWGTPQLTPFPTASPFSFSPPPCFFFPSASWRCPSPLPPFLHPSPLPQPRPCLCRCSPPHLALVRALLAVSLCRRRLLPLMLPRTLQSVPSPVFQSGASFPDVPLWVRCFSDAPVHDPCMLPLLPPSFLLVLVHVLLVCPPAFSCRRLHVLFAPFCVHLFLTSLLSRAPDVQVRAPRACPQSAVCLLAFLPRRPSWAPVFQSLAPPPSFAFLPCLSVPSPPS